MAFVDRLPPFARLEFLGRHQARGRLVAAGFLAGLLLFLLWWAFQPPIGVQPNAGPAAAGAATTPPTIGDADGVLDGITGTPAPIRGSVRGAPEVVEEQDRVEDEVATSFSDVDIVEDDAIAPPDDAVLADGYAEDGMPPPADVGADAMPMPMPTSPGGAALQPWYVDVEAAPGVIEQLRIEATSPEQALAILRDYRGDPRVLRGPSPQPLD